MTQVVPTTYQGYTIQPLVYALTPPWRKGIRPERRYLAAVTVTEVQTQAGHTSKLGGDFEFFGDARRAAEAHGRLIINTPRSRTTLVALDDPQRLNDAPFSVGIDSATKLSARAFALEGTPFSSGS